jgi:hypothetical protein
MLITIPDFIDYVDVRHSNTIYIMIVFSKWLLILVDTFFGCYLIISIRMLDQLSVWLMFHVKQY